MWSSKFFWCIIGLVNLFLMESLYVEAISNVRFNSNIREFEDGSKTKNSSEVKTLQKQERHERTGYIGRPVSKDFDNIQFKDDTDSDTSDSTHGRGFKFFPQNVFTGHDLAGYPGGYDDEVPPTDHFYHHQSYHEPHHLNHEHSHGHEYEHGHGHEYEHGHGHHFDKQHALAVKSFLLPIAGLAFLGAAAALISNPILLQLGVVSGRRRKRSTNPSHWSSHKINESRARKLKPGDIGEVPNLLYYRSNKDTTQRWKRLNLISNPSHQVLEQISMTTPVWPTTLQKNFVEESSENPMDLESILENVAKKYEIVRNRRKRQK